MIISLAQYFLYLKYFFLALLMVVFFAWLYLLITPIREIQLIKQGNIACALSFGGTLIGFCLTLSSSIAHSVSLPDFFIWGAFAMLVQLAVYFFACRLIGNGNEQLLSDNRAVGAFFASLSISIGLINAACLS